MKSTMNCNQIRIGLALVALAVAASCGGGGSFFVAGDAGTPVRGKDGGGGQVGGPCLPSCMSDPTILSCRGVGVCTSFNPGGGTQYCFSNGVEQLVSGGGQNLSWEVKRSGMHCYDAELASQEVGSVIRVVGLDRTIVLQSGAQKTVVDCDGMIQPIDTSSAQCKQAVQDWIAALLPGGPQCKPGQCGAPK